MTKTQKTKASQANVVGGALRKYRTKAGLTQKELAARCDLLGLKLTRGTLAKIEAQVRYVKACELFIIAKVLCVTLENFYPADFGNGAAGARGKRRAT